MKLKLCLIPKMGKSQAEFNGVILLARLLRNPLISFRSQIESERAK